MKDAEVAKLTRGVKLIEHVPAVQICWHVPSSIELKTGLLYEFSTEH